MAGGKASAVKLSTADRRRRSTQLRVQGLDLRAIADQMATEGFKTSLATVKRDIDRSLDDLNADARKNTERLVSLELERLNLAQSAATQAMMKGDPQAINAFVKVCESRRKLLGLDAPVQLQIQQGIAAEMAVRDEMLIALLEQTLDAENFAKVIVAAESLCEASAAAATN